MPLPPVLRHLPLPIIGAPLFIISHPKLVIEQCKAGAIGAMPALNARPAEQLDEWLAEITETLATHDRDPPSRKRHRRRHQIGTRATPARHDMQVCASTGPS